METVGKNKGANWSIGNQRAWIPPGCVTDVKTLNGLFLSLWHWHIFLLKGRIYIRSRAFFLLAFSYDLWDQTIDMAWYANDRFRNKCYGDSCFSIQAGLHCKWYMHRLYPGWSGTRLLTPLQNWGALPFQAGGGECCLLNACYRNLLSGREWLPSSLSLETALMRSLAVVRVWEPSPLISFLISFRESSSPERL